MPPPVPAFAGMGTLSRSKPPALTSSSSSAKSDEIARLREEQKRALEEEMRILKEEQERMRELDAKIAQARKQNDDDWLASGKLEDDDEFERLLKEQEKNIAAEARILSMSDLGGGPAVGRGMGVAARDRGSDGDGDGDDDLLSNELRELQRAQEEQLAELRKLEDEERAMHDMDELGLQLPRASEAGLSAAGAGDLADDPASEDPSICFTCGKRVEDTDPEPLKALNRLWHKDCWVCHECKKPLLGQRFGADGPYIYCEADYQRKFFCALCGKAIIDKIMQTADGRLYHNKCYEKRDDTEDADFKKWMEEFVKLKDKGKEDGAPAAPAAPGVPTPAPAAGDKQSVMLTKPLPAAPPGKAPAAGLSTSMGSSGGGSGISGRPGPSATVTSAADLAKLLPTTNARDSFKPRVITSPKDIAALDVPESYIFKITLPPTETKADPEKPVRSYELSCICL